MDPRAEVMRVMQDDFNHRDISVRVVDVTVEGGSILVHLEGAHGYTETWDWPLDPSEAVGPLHPPQEVDAAGFAYDMIVNLEEVYHSAEPFRESQLTKLEKQRVKQVSSAELHPIARDQLEKYLAEPEDGVDRGLAEDVSSVSLAAARRRKRLELAIVHLDRERSLIVAKLVEMEDRILLRCQGERHPKGLRMMLYAGGILRDRAAGRLILESWLAR